MCIRLRLRPGESGDFSNISSTLDLSDFRILASRQEAPEWLDSSDISESIVPDTRAVI